MFDKMRGVPTYNFRLAQMLKMNNNIERPLCGFHCFIIYLEHRRYYVRCVAFCIICSNGRRCNDVKFIVITRVGFGMQQMMQRVYRASQLNLNNNIDLCV